MILPKAYVHALLKGAREIRLPADYEHPVEEGTGELAPVRTAVHREPTCWVLITDWHFDDDTDEYVIEVRRCAAPDTPRMLMPKARAGDGLGYTSQPYMAMRDEPECVDEGMQKRISTEGWAGFNQRQKQRLLDRRLLALEERLKLAWGDGQRLGIDLSGNLRAIDRIVGSMERKTDQGKAA